MMDGVGASRTSPTFLNLTGALHEHHGDITSLPCNIGDGEELDVIWLGDSLVEHYLPLIEENLPGDIRSITVAGVCFCHW